MALLNVLLYCDARARTTLKEHWKPEVPNIGLDEVIRDFVVLGSQNSKRFYHCLIEKLDQTQRIVQYITNYNDGLPITQQILYWTDKDTITVYKKLWQDRVTDPFIETLAKRILKYRVNNIIVSVEDAENIYGITIDPQQIKIPHTFLGV